MAAHFSTWFNGSRRDLLKWIGATSIAGVTIGRGTGGTYAQEAGELTVGTPGASYRTDPNRATIGIYSPNVNT